MADRFLARRIRAVNAGRIDGTSRAAGVVELLPLLAEFWHQVQARVEARHAPGRLKLWLNSLRHSFVSADALYWAVRPLRSIDEMNRMLMQHGVPLSRTILQRVA